MSDLVTITGLVATDPRHLVTSAGLPITSFRLVSTHRRFDRVQQKWVDGESNWFTITSFRQLALNVIGSVQKGQRVVVTGRLRVRDWESGEKAGTTVEVDAEALGHDLAWGTAAFTRSIVSSGARAEAADPAGGIDAEHGAEEPVEPEGAGETEPDAAEGREVAALPF